MEMNDARRYNNPYLNNNNFWSIYKTPGMVVGTDVATAKWAPASPLYIYTFSNPALYFSVRFSFFSVN